ncbi:hypothetical protein [Dyadobacter fanqingshengii]|uniref:Uncharacterized protein n=1 Tax=Dyadobacter fanqingshengii TaxID=2906443 RepID=A0A9X1PBX9_9BACT|nr:hypothetical protein [Dyadobacter fanqingshengii]MCF0041725.1 hypothetical protein [Dyadobacter fanqingshengii]USJ36561.1 hypothetical protein NFI81_02060 [Dyadobacter fanqingshengii]
MDALNLLSSIVIIAAAVMTIYKAAKLSYKLFTNADLTVTNTKTGKSVKIGSHPTEIMVKKLLEVIS